MTQITVENRSLPATIETTLRGLIRRVRLAIIVRGVLLTLAAAILGMLASMGIAVSWLPSEPWQHYALTFLWLAAAAATAFVWLARPLAKSFSLAGIARVIEQRHPELQERLSSTVELLGSGDSPEIRGSQVLIDALAAEAVGDARTVRPKREITFRKVRPPLYVLGGAVAFIALLLAIYPKPMGRLLAKTVAPYLNLPNIYADDLRITPGDCVLAEGMRLEVTVSTVRADGATRTKVRAAKLRIERTGGTKDTFEMTTLPDGSFVYTSGPLSADGPWGESFRYRIHAGDARSQYYRAKVVPRPAARSIEVGYEYPDYMRRPGAPMLAGSGLIAGPTGTVATVRIRLNKPAADAQLTVNETAAEITQADPLTYTFTHNLGKDTGGKWKLLLRDEYGFRSDPLGGEIVVRPDTPPNVRILQPDGQKKLKLRPTDRLAITADLADDFGLSRAEMLISIDGKQRKTVNLNVAATQPFDSAQAKPDRLGLTSQATLNLALLDLAGARKVTFRVRAWDNLPKTLGGPQEGTSKTRTIELDVKAPVYAFQVQLALDIRLREALQQIYKQLQAAKKISEPLRRSMPGTKTLTRQTTDKIDRMRETLMAAEDTSGRLAELVAGAYPKISGKLTKLADDHIGKARELAGLVKITDAQKQRAELTDEADFQIDRALAVVSELLKELHVLTDLSERAVALEELAKRQEELAAAKTPTTMPTTQPDAEGLSELSEKQWKQAQRQVASDTAEMVRQTPRAMHEALKDKGKQTTDLAEAAKQLQRGQQALAKSATDQQSVEEMKKQLAKLAAEQAKIARQTSQMARQTPKVAPTKTPAAEATKTTADAAKALTTTQPAKAIPAQADAIKSLDETAQRAAAEQLAAAAETMATRQEALAKYSETAKKYQAQAQAAHRAAAQHRAQQRQTLAPVAKRSTDLAQRQAALAKQAQQLEKATSPPKSAKPAKAMQAAADNIRKGDLNPAQRQASQAARQAQTLANEMARRETSAKQVAATAAKAAQQAGAKADQADAKAKAARADAQAKAAQAKAARADANAKTAQAKAAQAAAQAAAKAKAPDAGEKANAAKTAAQAAKTAQQANAKAAQAAKSASQASAKAAQAAKAAGQASAKAAQTARQTDSKVAGTARSAAAGKQLAKQQADLTREIAEAAKREATPLATAAKSAQQADAQQAVADRATRQVQSLAKTQTKLTKQVEQLKELAKQATRQAAAAMSRHDPTRNMQQAASQLQRIRPDQAGKPQTAAAEQLRQIAKAARGGNKPAASLAAASSIARTSRSLAQTQRDLHKRTRKLVDQLTKAQAQRRQQELTRLRAEQQKIAKQAAKLSDDVKAQSPQPDRIDTHAARSAAEASKQLAGNRLGEAAKSAGKAAGELGELAGRLGKAQAAAAAPQSDAQAAAERRGKLAGRAGQLAQKQRQVGRQIADLAAGKMPQVLAGRQGQIAEQTKKTAEDVKLLEEHIAELMPDAAAKKLTQSATKSLQQASAAQGKAGRAMSSGKPGQSVPSQQASAKSLAQAAAALAQLGRQFAAQARKNPPAPAGKDADKTPGQLAEAYDAAQTAAQNQSAGEAAKAARLLAALAKQALQQARAMGMMPGAMGAQGMAMAQGTTLDSDARIGAAGTDLRTGELVELGISADDWARLPGRLKDQVLQAARISGPEEYRILIKRYFRALAKKAVEKDSNRKEETK